MRRQLMALFGADPAEYEVRHCALLVWVFALVPSSWPVTCAVLPARGCKPPQCHMPVPPLQLVFTRSATGALQLIGEMFPWSGGSQYAYLRSNHKSVLGEARLCCGGRGIWGGRLHPCCSGPPLPSDK